MLGIFVNVILPVFLVAGLGLLLYLWKKPSAAPIGFLVLNLFSPALVFTSMARTDLEAVTFLRVTAFVVLLAIATLTMGWIAARALRADRPTESAMLLGTTFMNVGNLGIPVATFAFGPEVLDRTVTFFVIQAILTWTVGATIAARSSAKGWKPLLSGFRLPSIYAALLGIAVSALGVHVPVFIMRPAELLAQAAIPAMLVVLGLQLATGTVKQWLPMLTATGIRLIASAAIAVPLAAFLGLRGLDRDVVVVMAAMPPAVFTTILATEFKSNPALVTSTVVFSTAVSLVTLTVVIRLLQVFG